MEHRGRGSAQIPEAVRGEVGLPRDPGERVLEGRRRAQEHLSARLRAVAEVDRAIERGGPSDEVLGLIAHCARQLVGASVSMVLLREESGDLSVCAAEGGNTEVFRGMRLPARASLAGAILWSGEARRIADLSGKPLPNRDLVMAGRFGPALLIPLKVRARVVGVLQVANETGGHQFDDKEFESVRLFAAQVGLALESHLSVGMTLLDALALEDRSAQTRQRLKRMAPAGVDRGGLLRQTLDTLAQTAVELTDAIACTIQVLEPGGYVQTAGSFGMPGELVAAMDLAHRRGAPDAAEETMASGGPVVVVNERDRILADDRFRAVHGLVQQLAWGSVTCLPLGSPTGSHAALCYFFRPEQRADESDLRCLRLIAAQAATAVDNAQVLAAASRKVALEERQRLARELHDSVSQALYGIALGARTALEQLEHHPILAREPVNYVLQQADAALAEMRALIFELRPESLESEGLAAALVKQADAVRARKGVAVETLIEGVPDSSLEAHQALYRIAQEALNNAANHARASRIELRLSSDDASLTVEVADDGTGFEADAEFPGHLGLRSMQERAAALGGTCRVISRPGTGTRVVASVPRFPNTGLIPSTAS